MILPPFVFPDKTISKEGSEKIELFCLIVVFDLFKFEEQTERNTVVRKIVMWQKIGQNFIYLAF